jgi:hypothetical protein
MVTRGRSDESKRVIDVTSGTVGVVPKVRGDAASVEPDAGIADTAETVPAGDVDEDDDRLRAESIERVTDDEIH